MEITEDKEFEGIDFQIKGFLSGEYAGCRFIKCNFNQLDLSKSIFIDCEFVDSNLSLIKIKQVICRNVTFIDTKMLGIRFDEMNPFGLQIEFKNVVLDHAVFHNVKMPKTNFSHCSLKEVDFSLADFSGSLFEHCDFHHAVFDSTNLEKADFSTSINYSINPQQNRIKKSKHRYPAILGLLDVVDIIHE